MALIEWLEEMIENVLGTFSNHVGKRGISLTSIVSLALRVTSGLTQLRPQCPHNLLGSGG